MSAICREEGDEVDGEPAEGVTSWRIKQLLRACPFAADVTVLQAIRA
jgi:hypothetical protein